MTLQTDIPVRAEIEGLLTVRGGPCVSIYVPTSPLTQEAEAGRIELKTLTAQALRQLEEAGTPRREMTAIREPLEELASDEDFWATQAHSLAVFATPDSVRTYRLPNQLSSAMEVGDRFYVKPLLRTTTFPQAAFVLGLAAGSVRLVEVTPDTPAHRVDVPDLPADLEAAAGAAAERSPSARLTGAEGEKVRLRQFARKVDQALRGVLAGQELPLILAATDPLDAIFRATTSYPHLVATGIRGNHESSTDDELAAAARPLLDALYAEELDELRSSYEARLQDDRASADVATVARAATRGAVRTLLVDIDQKVDGTVDEETGAVTFADSDGASSYGVVDEIARRVLLTGGRVLAVRRDDVPAGSAVAAIFRHPL